MPAQPEILSTKDRLMFVATTIARRELRSLHVKPRDNPEASNQRVDHLFWWELAAESPDWTWMRLTFQFLRAVEKDPTRRTPLTGRHPLRRVTFETSTVDDLNVASIVVENNLPPGNSIYEVQFCADILKSVKACTIRWNRSFGDSVPRPRSADSSQGIFPFVSSVETAHTTSVSGAVLLDGDTYRETPLKLP